MARNPLAMRIHCRLSNKDEFCAVALPLFLVDQPTLEMVVARGCRRDGQRLRPRGDSGLQRSQGAGEDRRPSAEPQHGPAASTSAGDMDAAEGLAGIGRGPDERREFFHQGRGKR